MNRRVAAFMRSAGLAVTIIVLLASCSTTKYVAENERLLSRVQIYSDARDIKRSDLKPYLRQQENLRTLGFWKFHLGLYNLSGRDDSKGINRWLKNIGEAPVIFDSTLVDRSAEQIKLFLNNRGYYLSDVDYQLSFPSDKKAKVSYYINSGVRYRLNELYYKIEDKNLESLVLNDTINRSMRRGRGFTSQMHERERERITETLRNNGYYNFAKEYIYFIADSTVGNYRINDTLVVMKPAANAAGRTAEGNHARYIINSLYFHVNIDPQELSFEDNVGIPAADTLVYDGVHIIYEGKLDFNPNVLTNSNYIVPGDIYRSSLVERTQSLLSGLQIFKYISIRFYERPGERDKDGNYLLDCVIHLIPGKYQSYAVEVEGTNSSGNLGAAGSLKYQHKNLFNGAELFTFSTRLARENQVVLRGGSGESFKTIEFGSDVSVVFPKFFMPFRIEGFRQRYNPKTTIALAYNHQRRPDYTRTIFNARLGYNWRSSRFSSHSLSPIDFNLVDIPAISQSFLEYIEENPFLRNSYENHLIANINYSYTYNQQQLTQRNRDFWYFRYTAESAGNILDLMAPVWGSGGEEDYNTFLGIRYAQYFKTDFDIRFHNAFNRNTSLTYRLFAGVGLPYGNLNVLPFEKRYFSGGANSIRAWPVRAVGPGTFSDETTRFYNQTADIKLEANLEYRFPLFWLIEGALFVDAGNIWGIKSDSSPEGGLFEWNKFYKQLAVGAGFGTRFDFSYFIFRLDTGFKIHDPAVTAEHNWIPFSRSYKWSDVAFNFAIGYPF